LKKLLEPFYILTQIISDRSDQIDWSSIDSTDWENLYTTAQAEKVAPLLYWKLKISYSRIGLSIPEVTLDRLRISYSQNCSRNAHLYRNLGEVFDILDDDIPIIVLKGAAIAQTVYPDIGLRHMQDIDLLVPEVKLPDIVKLLESMGYKPAIPDFGLDILDLLSNQVALIKTSFHNIPLEIHSSIIASKAYDYAVPVDWFWSQIERFSCPDSTNGNFNSTRRKDNVFKLTPTAQLLHSAVHLTLQHGAGKVPLLWFYDIHRLMQVFEFRIDWELLINKAVEFRWESALKCALSQTRDNFGTNLPDGIIKKLSRRSNTHVQKIVEIKQKSPQTRMEGEWQVLVSINPRHRLKLILVLLFPTFSYMRWRYQIQTTWSLPFFYVYRWLDILSDGIRTILLLVSNYLKSNCQKKTSKKGSLAPLDPKTTNEK